jgi:hypothetical protein
MGVSQANGVVATGSTTITPIRTIAASGYTYAAGTPLRPGINRVTSGNIAECVSLPLATGSGAQIDVHVDTTYFIVVMPNIGEQINQFGASIGYAVFPRQRIRFIDVGTGLWDFTTNLPLLYPIENTITAAADGTQASSYYLAMGNNVIRTNTAEGGSVRLPIALGGCNLIAAYNDTDKSVRVYPNDGQYINQLAVNEPLYLPPGKMALFNDIGPNDDQWVGGIVSHNPAPETVSMGIPLIYAGSGSMANNGALTLTTALITAYPNAYIYLPANAISAGSAAGFYYAVMSSTTVGTVYNNTYTPASGTLPQVPSSPTAFATVGPGAFTGGSAEIDALVVGFPAGSMGNNGYLEISEIATFTNTASAKSMTIRWGAGAGAGQIISNPNIVSNLSLTDYRKLVNRGRADRQVIQGGGSASLGATANSPAYPSINTANAFAVYFCMTKVAADNIVLEAAAITKHYAF